MLLQILGRRPAGEAADEKTPKLLGAPLGPEAPPPPVFFAAEVILQTRPCEAGRQNGDEPRPPRPSPPPERKAYGWPQSRGTGGSGTRPAAAAPRPGPRPVEGSAPVPARCAPPWRLQPEATSARCDPSFRRICLDYATSFPRKSAISPIHTGSGPSLHLALGCTALTALSAPYRKFVTTPPPLTGPLPTVDFHRKWPFPVPFRCAHVSIRSFSAAFCRKIKPFPEVPHCATISRRKSLFQRFISLLRTSVRRLCAPPGNSSPVLNTPPVNSRRMCRNPHPPGSVPFLLPPETRARFQSSPALPPQPTSAGSDPSHHLPPTHTHTNVPLRSLSAPPRQREPRFCPPSL